MVHWKILCIDTMDTMVIIVIMIQKEVQHEQKCLHR